MFALAAISAEEILEFNQAETEEQIKTIYERIARDGRSAPDVANTLMERGFSCRRTAAPTEAGEYGYVCHLVYCNNGKRLSLYASIGARTSLGYERFGDTIGFMPSYSLFSWCLSPEASREAQEEMMRRDMLSSRAD